jgi:hypothetical protein
MYIHRISSQNKQFSQLYTLTVYSRQWTIFYDRRFIKKMCVFILHEKHVQIYMLLARPGSASVAEKMTQTRSEQQFF